MINQTRLWLKGEFKHTDLCDLRFSIGFYRCEYKTVDVHVEELLWEFKAVVEKVKGREGKEKLRKLCVRLHLSCDGNVAELRQRLLKEAKAKGVIEPQPARKGKRKRPEEEASEAAAAEAAPAVTEALFHSGGIGREMVEGEEAVRAVQELNADEVAPKTQEAVGGASSSGTGEAAASSTTPRHPYTFLGANFDVAMREVARVHGSEGVHMLNTMRVIVKLLEGMLDKNEAAKLRDPGLYEHCYLFLKEPRLNELFFDDLLNKGCGSLSVGEPLDGKGASRHFEAVCAAGYDVIHLREVHATEGTRAKAGPKSAADLVTLLLRVEGGGSGKLLKSGAGIKDLRDFLAGHRARIEMAFLTELKHNRNTQPQLVAYSYANGELKDLQLPIKGLLGVNVDKPPTEAARIKKGLLPDYGFRSTRLCV